MSWLDRDFRKDLRELQDEEWIVAVDRTIAALIEAGCLDGQVSKAYDVAEKVKEKFVTGDLS